VGDIADRLDLDDALLFFTSDHGDYGGRRGLVRKIPWIPFDDLAKVACFAAGGVVAGGRVEASPMQAFDFATTALSLAGADVDLTQLDGIDLSGYLADPTAHMDPDRMVVSALTMAWPMVRRREHKYIRELGWGEEVLFDVVRDPDEQWNVMSLDADRTITDELSAEVDRQLAAGPPDLPDLATDARGVRPDH